MWSAAQKVGQAGGTGEGQGASGSFMGFYLVWLTKAAQHSEDSYPSLLDFCPKPEL